MQIGSFTLQSMGMKTKLLVTIQSSTTPHRPGVSQKNTFRWMSDPQSTLPRQGM
jgi:hypothetical protein